VVHYVCDVTSSHTSLCARRNLESMICDSPKLCNEEGQLIEFTKKSNAVNFLVTPCINNIQHFNNQLTHTTLKNIELLKHSKISKTAPKYFGLQGNHLQGATVST